MAVKLITTHRVYIGLSTDTKLTNPPAGSTFHAYNTGEQFVFDGSDWQDDLRLIYALENSN